MHIKGDGVPHNATTSHQSGFTLVELALVLTIMGLLAGGVLKAQEMIANARATSTIAQIQAYQKAVGIFYDSYLAIPGDFNAAQKCLPNCTTATNCTDGNGDKMVGSAEEAWKTIDATINSENTQLWRHLALADLMQGVAVSGTQTGFGISHPASRLSGGFHARQADAASEMPDGLVLVLRASPQGTWQGGTRGMAISPKDAAKIDRKIDDGAAFSGYAYAISNGHNDGCGTQNAGTQGETGYDETSAERSCDMIFKLWPAPPSATP